ncbi:MAG: hypothetical protein C0491_06315 [Novosphingobium sp.]|nr:hypothetical protein [Novosphingobium sp.]
MSKNMHLVPFDHGDILIVSENDVPQVVMPTVVANIGLDWEPQRKRIERHPLMAEGTSIMEVPSAGGRQSTTVMTLEGFHTWLVTLHPDRVSAPEIRERVLAYQRRAFRVVFEHFHGPIRIAPAKPASVSEFLRVGNALKKETNRKLRADLWTRYEQITDSWGIPRGERIGIGYDEPDYSEMVAAFWAAVRGLEEVGIEVNFSRRNDLIALNLPDLRAKFAEVGIVIDIGRAEMKALRHSKDPRYLGEKPVNGHDGKARYCWVFSVVPELPLEGS